jgi:hypothetical protein
MHRILYDSLLRQTAIIKGAYGSHMMSNYVHDDRKEEIIALARGHGLLISAVTVSSTSTILL